MALNYQRIGWEDAPSTNTPLDAANLNHMDNGIVAVSNEFDRVIPGLEEIAETVSPLIPNMSTMTQDISTLQGQTSALATQAQHILGNFATVEEGETASANYSTGQHVVLGDYLYKVIDDIAQGESFVENTNIEKTTVGSEIKADKSDSGSNSNGYYCKMSDGTLMQWGAFTFPNASAGDQHITITLPLAYPSSAYNVVLSWNDNSMSIPDYFSSLAVPSKSESQFVAGARRIHADYSWHGSWIAIGRWK